MTLKTWWMESKLTRIERKMRHLRGLQKIAREKHNVSGLEKLTHEINALVVKEEHVKSSLKATAAPARARQ